MGQLISYIGGLAGKAAPIAAAGAQAYQSIASIEEQKQARKAAEKIAERKEQLGRQQIAAYERQAGEYYELTREQMEMQAQASQITTLADLITQRETKPAAQKVVTLPQRVELGPIEQINQAIDQLLRG
ncbi:hypothetical protein ES703_34814 [subsurface metagenome]